MLELTLGGKIRICLDFSFFAVITLFLCFDTSGYGFMGVVACLLHETGHILALIISGKTPERITFYGGGIKLGLAAGEKRSVFMLAAGSAMNFTAFAFFMSFADMNSIYPVLFAFINLMIGGFNLLPAGYLDGKLLLEALLIKTARPESIAPILRRIEAVTVTLMLVLAVFLFLAGYLNFTVGIVMIYLIFVDIITGI